MKIEEIENERKHIMSNFILEQENGCERYCYWLEEQLIGSRNLCLELEDKISELKGALSLMETATTRTVIADGDRRGVFLVLEKLPRTWDHGNCMLLHSVHTRAEEAEAARDEANKYGDRFQIEGYTF